MTPLLRLCLAISMFAVAALLVRLLVYLFQRSHKAGKTKTVKLGRDAAKYRKGQKLLVDGKRRQALKVAEVDERAGTVTFEPLPPPTAADRKAPPKETALLLALGFDPATHDVMPVLQPWRGVQVLRNGERVRFFTERQVKAKAGAWKTALRAGSVSA